MRRRRREAAPSDGPRQFALFPLHQHVGGPLAAEVLTTSARTAWWRQVFEVVDRALEIPPLERPAYVEQACAREPGMAAAAANMLENGDDPGFLETPAAEFLLPLLGDLIESSGDALVGAQIGSYRILREIGRGGMGTIYLAERADEQYEKHVALKVLPAWSAGNSRLVQRFREERQILAALDHPDIARLFDGGVTADGRPWFALEYVDGVPIDRFCDDRLLSLNQRLDLFCRVCAAVQYAHRNLVVHRDLKPANIFVTREGQVKLLDFGIAKLLGGDAAGDSASVTVTGERLMTPVYASPEQIRGSAISTASDVYSLGVLLYELLTGRYPYRLATRESHEVARAILEQEPERPSVAASRPSTPTAVDAGQSPDEGAAARGMTAAKLARRLRGDLDTIVLTAMHKDAASRYGTADQLEADVRRHLGGHPLAVRPESSFVRVRKFVRRHRIGVAMATAVAVLVLAFAGVTAVQTLRIRAQASRIAVERDHAEQAFSFLTGLFQSSDPYSGARTDLPAREILDSGAARVDRELVGQPEARARMMFEIGRAYFGLGLRDRARRFLEVSLSIRRRTAPVNRVDIARTLDFLGLVRLEEGDLDDAERAYREALALRRELLGARHREVARTLNGLASVMRAAGRFRDADSVSREAVAIDEAQPEAHRLDLAESLKGLAHPIHERGDHREAGRLYQRALAIQRRDLGEAHPEALGTLLDLAVVLGDMGERPNADSLFRHGIALHRRTLGDDHPQVARGEASYARLLHRGGNLAAAEPLYRHALGVARRRLPSLHPLTSTILLGLGELLLDRGEATEAEPLLRQALAMRRSTLSRRHPAVADAEGAMGVVTMARGRYVEAERYLFASHEVLRAVHGDADARTRAALSRLIRLYEASGHPARAATLRAQYEGSAPVIGARRTPGAAATLTGAAAVLDTYRSPRLAAESSGSRTVDPHVVAIIPFPVQNSQPALFGIGGALEDLIAANLTGADGIPSALDPASVRAYLARSALSRNDFLPPEQSLSLARDLGAGRLLRGKVSGTPAELSIEAELVAVPGGSVRARAQVHGSADSLPHLSDRLVARLLAVQAARDSDELAGLTGTSPAALRAYLAGVHAFSRGRVGVSSEATAHFEDALFLDSTFALAGLRLAQIASTFGSSELDEFWKFNAIWNQRDRLGPADRALLLAYLGPRYPLPPTLAELIAAAERAAVAAPNRAEAWVIAGETLLRFGSKVGHPRWEMRAHEALTRAHALDSTNSSTLAYLLLMAVRAGDSAAVRRFAALHSAHNPVGAQAQFTEFYRWAAAIALGDSAGTAAVRSRFPEMTRGSLRALVDWSQGLGVGLGDAERAARIFTEGATHAGNNRAVMMGIVPFLLNRGRPGEASRLLASAERGFGDRADVGVLEFRIHAALYWDGDATEAAAAARALEAYLAGEPLPRGQVRDPRTAACALAHWRLAAGDFAGTTAALARMRRLATAGGSTPIELIPMCAAAVDAQLAAAQNRPDAGIALERLDALLREGADVQLLLPTVASVVATRLHEGRGDLRQALALTRRRALWWSQLLSTQLREEGRLAAAVGDTAGAIRAYHHYLALRSEAEPHLRGDVERVRTELAALTNR